MSKNKIVEIIIPRELPFDMSQFSLEENYIILTTGINALIHSKNNEISKSMEFQLNEKIEELILQLKIQQENYENSLEKMQQLFFSKINTDSIPNNIQLQCAVSNQKEQMNTMFSKMSAKENEISQYKYLLEKSIQDNTHKLENVMKLAKQKKINLLEEGVPILPFKTFRSIATSAFGDVPDFSFMDDIHSENNPGEFELKFKDFSVWVNIHDSKKETMKQQIMEKKACFFGWLISMETNIDEYEKSPFMFEWLSGNKCNCYVNSILSQHDPVEILRSIYFTCQTIYHITHMDATDITEFHKLKENEKRFFEISQNMVKNAQERDEIILKLKESFQVQDDMVRQLLNKETNRFVDKSFTRVVDWWNFHIVNDEGCIMRSSNIWTMFKRDNPDMVGEIQANEFKDILYTFLSEDRIIKPRNKFGALEIKNVRWKIDRSTDI
jgi:hypothetical protein